jgi:hypothetical protein
VSTIAPFKAELVALLTAAIPTVQVIYGPATGAALTGPDVMVVGNVTGTTGDGSLAAMGGTTRESYDVAVTVSCSRPGPDSQALATAAAFAFYDTATAAVAVAVPTTPGVLLAQVTGDFELVEDDSTQAATQRNAAVVFTVHVESSI